MDLKYQSKLLRLSAHDRDVNKINQSNSDFTIDLGSNSPELKRVVAVQIISVSIRNLFYNITSGKNTFVFDDNVAAPHTITITPGNYDITAFMTAFLDAIDTELGYALGTSSYTFNDITSKITITFPESIDFVSDKEDNPLAYRLGYGYETFSGTTIAATHIIMLSGPDLVCIHSPELSNGTLDFGAVSDTIHVVAEVPIDQEFGFVCFYQPSNPNIIKYQNVNSFSSIRVLLRDVEGGKLDIDQGDWNITLKCYYLI